MPNELTTLNVAERSKLRVCESTIQKHLATFVEVGTALAEINDGQLYRETHKTFEAYVKARWDLSRNYAYRLIAASEVAETVANCQQKPTSEAQARPLVALPAEQQAEAWEAAVEKAKEAGKAVTAAIVEEVVEEILEQAEPVNEPEPEPEEEETLADQMKASNTRLDALARAILALHKEAVDMDEPHLSASGRIEILHGHLRAAAGTVRVAKGAGECPYCNGKGCKHCHKTGWATKEQIDAAPL